MFFLHDLVKLHVYSKCLLVCLGFMGLGESGSDHNLEVLCCL